MQTPPERQPSVWIAVVLAAFVVVGGGVSVAIQGWQTRTRLQAAASDLTGGNPKRGKAIISRVGCGACHQIPGVPRADGAVGPPLGKVAVKAFLPGDMANSPPNLVRWVQHPQSLEPRSGMPNPPVNDQEARDIAAYLYTLK